MLRVIIVGCLLFSCSCELDRNWWKHTIVYELYVRSFKDSNGDGIGDLKGVTMKLDHFVDLGIETLYLSPFYKSPMNDSGYDVSDYTAIEPVFGTSADFDELIREMEKRGMKMIADFVVNHCSDEHEWFVKSVNGVKPYDEYFIWKDPKGYDEAGKPIPPNNWLSIFIGGAWEWNEKRKQFYFHQFAKKQPDLNLRNPLVKEEVKNILNFWLDKGVSGLRLDATKFYIEDKLFRDEPLLDPQMKQKSKVTYDDLDHIYTNDLWECYEFIHEMKNIVNEYNKKKGGYERIFVAEAYTSFNMTIAYYGTEDYEITNFPFNFEFIPFTKSVNAIQVDAVIWNWLRHMPKGGTPNWMSENHDRDRIGSKISEEHSEIFNFLVMTLPGVACIYFGQEIGMINGPIRTDQIHDALVPDPMAQFKTRDVHRTPMQWDNTINSGFTSRRKSWLPVNPNYGRINVEEQRKNEMSHYNMFKHLSRLRRLETFKNGKFDSRVISKNIHLYRRYLPGYPTYYVLSNFGKEYEIVDLEELAENVPATLFVEMGSSNSGFKKGQKITTKNNNFPHEFVLRPYSAVILTTSLSK